MRPYRFLVVVSILRYGIIDVVNVRVNANNLSPMKMAESYWCLFSASWRQSLKNFSIVGVVAFAEQWLGHESDSIGREKCGSFNIETRAFC
jgi:hypothetical protein